MSTYETKEIVEKVVLLGVDVGDDTKESMKELAELVDTAGATVLDSIIQSRERMHPGTYIGKGKIEEVKDRVIELGATGVVCDDELTPAQLRNLEDLLDTKVMDRTMVILDIFAKRATTSEGKIQVELAQLKFSSARLVGLRSSLSRLGGGIGTRAGRQDFGNTQATRRRSMDQLWCTNPRLYGFYAGSGAFLGPVGVVQSQGS